MICLLTKITNADMTKVYYYERYVLHKSEHVLHSHTGKQTFMPVNTDMDAGTCRLERSGW